VSSFGSGNITTLSHWLKWMQLEIRSIFIEVCIYSCFEQWVRSGVLNFQCKYNLSTSLSMTWRCNVIVLKAGDRREKESEGGTFICLNCKSCRAQKAFSWEMDERCSGVKCILRCSIVLSVAALAGMVLWLTPIPGSDRLFFI